MEKTLSIIKPNGIKNAGNIIAMIQELDCEIVDMKMLKLTTEQASLLYEEHKESDRFERLVSYMSDKPVIAMILEGPDIVKEHRKLMKIIRGLYSEYYGDRPGWYSPPMSAYNDLSRMANAIHGSDSVESANREINIIFN